MTDKSLETEVSNLKIYRQQMANDIHDLKSDVKEIKVFLMGSETEEPKIVTRREFDAYKQAQVWQKALIGVSFTFIGALITYFIQNVTK